METIKISRHHQVKEQILKNLLTAQERTADKGDVKGTIKIAKYLLHIFNKQNDEIVYLFSEGDEKWGREPIK